MSIALIPAEPANDTAAPLPRSPYARYADVFSRVHAETGSIEIALEVVDTYRAREGLARPKPADLPVRIVEIAARLFGVLPKRLIEADRHKDVVAARWIAAWLLHRRRWSTLKIGSFLKHDHSTILFGLRRVAADRGLLIAAHKAEALLEAPEGEGAP
jgi:chromosomal replication initiation ATPase DnaA